MNDEAQQALEDIQAESEQAIRDNLIMEAEGWDGVLDNKSD